MNKIITFAFLFAVMLMSNLQAQKTTQTTKPDYWGTFCLVSHTVGDTNYFKVDLTQLPSEFEKIYFKNYYLEQDVFHTQIKKYDVEKGEAIIAVPKKYAVKDYRPFMGDMKKMTNTANNNYTNEQKNNYILKNKEAK
jgi:hypothetical protein